MLFRVILLLIATWVVAAMLRLLAAARAGLRGSRPRVDPRGSADARGTPRGSAGTGEQPADPPSQDIRPEDIIDARFTEIEEEPDHAAGTEEPPPSRSRR